MMEINKWVKYVEIIAQSKTRKRENNQNKKYCIFFSYAFFMIGLLDNQITCVEKDNFEKPNFHKMKDAIL